MIGLGAVMALMAPLAACSGGPDGIVVNDQTGLNYWMEWHYPVLAPRTFLYPIGSATLGYGVPAAIGAKIARPDRPVLCAAGNHEEKDGNGSAYKTRLSQPGNGRYYSYVLNNVQFVISTGGAFVADGTLLAELLWLETTLAQASLRRARGEIDFIAFVQHFTLWTDEEGRPALRPSWFVSDDPAATRTLPDRLPGPATLVRSEPVRLRKGQECCEQGAEDTTPKRFFHRSESEGDEARTSFAGR